MDDDNIFQFGAIAGGKDDEPKFPSNDYVIIDIEDHEWYATGFLLFTPHHLAIMKTTSFGGIPSLVLPIGRVKAAELAEDGQEDLPF